jgi:hypothetical protein
MITPTNGCFSAESAKRSAHFNHFGDFRKKQQKAWRNALNGPNDTRMTAKTAALP